MTRYLVAYYSRTGNTAKVANTLAGILSADIEQIHDGKSRSGPFAFVAAIIACMLRKSAPIAPSTKDLTGYDVVLIGSPVWGANMATPIRTFIEQERANIKQLALFCTFGGSGGKSTLKRMATHYGQQSVADLRVDKSAFASGEWRGLTGNFAQQIRNAVTTKGAGAVQPADVRA